MYMYVQMYTYIHTYEYVHTEISVRTYVRTYMHTYIHKNRRIYTKQSCGLSLCSQSKASDVACNSVLQCVAVHLQGINNRHFCSDSKTNQILVILRSLSRVFFFHRLCSNVLQCIAVSVAVCCRVLLKRRNRQTKSISALFSFASNAAMHLSWHKRKQDRKKAKVHPPPQLSIKTPRVNNNYISYQ